MSSQPKSLRAASVLFGPFEFDLASGDLLKFGRRVRLQGQPLAILGRLLRQPGEVVTREEIRKELWRDDTFVGFEHGLNAAVNRLRQALGDSAESPRYIETLPGRGYRFIAPVEAALPKVVVEMQSAPKARRRSWRLWAGCAAGILALIGAYYAGVRNSRRDQSPPVQFTVSPPPGYVLEPAAARQSLAISPDGTHLAFSALDQSGLYSIFVRDLRQPEPKLVPGTRGAYSVMWGHDSSTLLYSFQKSLMRTDLKGSPPQTLGDVPVFLYSAIPLPDGRLIASAPGAIFEYSRHGGPPKRIEGNHRWPQLLPGGTVMLYSDFQLSAGRHQIYAGEFGKPNTARQLIESDSRAIYAPSQRDPSRGYLLTVRAGNLIAYPFDPKTLQVLGPPKGLVEGIYSFQVSGAADFSVSDTGVLAYRKYRGESQLAWVDRNGRVVRYAGPKGVNLKAGVVSPDGTKIATAIFDVTRGATSIWIVDEKTGTSRALSRERGLTTSPVWSPDSKALVYARAYSRGPTLFLRGVAQDSVEQQIAEDYFQLPGSWSPDGRFVAYVNHGYAQMENEMHGDILMVDLKSKGKPTAVVKSPFHESNPAFSPDGKWLAFTSNESGRTEVYLQAFEGGDPPRVGGERILVSRTGAACLRWRRDGKEIYFVGADGVLYAAPILLAARPEIGKPTPLFSISLEARGAVHALLGFDVSPDGRSFLIPTVDQSSKPEITVVQNWEAAFSASLPN